MKCSRCTGGNATHKSGKAVFCLPCATLLASALPDPYWKSPMPRLVLQLDLRRSIGWWRKDDLERIACNGAFDPLGTVVSNARPRTAA